MKRLFSKTLKSISPSPAPSGSSSNSKPPLQVPVTHTTGLQPKYLVPPLPHPCPYDQIAVLATPRGLLLRPHLTDRTHLESHVLVHWGKEVKVEEVHNDGEAEDADWGESAVVHGIVGIMTLYSGSFLLVISSRSDVGNLLDERHAVYCVKSVTVIPLTEARARAAIRSMKLTSRSPSPPAEIVVNTAGPEDGLSDSTHGDNANDADEPLSPHVKFANEDQVKLVTPIHAQAFDVPDDEDNTPPTPSSVASSPSSEYSMNTGNIAKVLADRLSFWSRLSKRSSNLLQPAVDPVNAHAGEAVESLPSSDEHEPVSLATMMEEGDKEPTQVLDSILANTAPPPHSADAKHSELEEKVIRECVKEFTRGGMYFAYNFDITRSLQHKQEQIANAKKKNALLADLNAIDDAQRLSPAGDKVDVLAEPSPTLPLWRRVDRHFWWNEWLSKPFIDAGLHPYVLPIMQGFYQIASFAVPREPEDTEEGDFALVDYILISRRSRDRAGLRYQRRGIDDDANVSNFVETETVMRVEREGFSNIFSHVQIRGSIPLYWSQIGYSLKPPPVLSPERSHAQNLETLRRHFSKTIARYGPHTIINLAEQHGKESAVTHAYRSYVSELDSEDVRYHEYDFHAETKGMKYENISKLIENMQRTFESQGYLWISNDSLMSRQKGVFRVNCIDCLDRTNVVEESKHSAFARHVLNRQLGAVALLDHSGNGRTETDVVFNDVWANNGDAISRAYAGTSALKGDFTRTGKRDLTGMLNDGVNSLARMYTSTFGDWFSQAVIDFMLGNRSINVFSEFLLKLQSSDPRDLIRISKIRAEAIATSVSRVLADGERLLSGWTLFAPEEMNVKIGHKFEEKVLLLSVKALYVISYDYTLEKVKMYTRVPLGDIIGITKGAYILSPLEEGSRDPLQNAGFVITWRNSHQDTRVTSYSIKNSPNDVGSPPPSPGIPLSPRLFKTPRKGTALSRILSQAAAPVMSNDVTFAAFKALPIDPTRSRRENGSFAEPADELTGATNCKEAVDLMVETICRACEDVGNAPDDFVGEGDVVSLAEAQRMTSVYAKMEYGVKRLLWLGG